MDLCDGEILYLYGVDCEGCIPSKVVINASVRLLLGAFDDENGNMLLAVMYNILTPEQAMKQLED